MHYNCQQKPFLVSLFLLMTSQSLLYENASSVVFFLHELFKPPSYVEIHSQHWKPNILLIKVGKDKIQLGKLLNSRKSDTIDIYQATMIVEIYCEEVKKNT